MVWDVDPAQQEITVHCANTPPNLIANTGTLHGDDLLPGNPGVAWLALETGALESLVRSL